MGIDKICRYCGKKRVRSNSGGIIICDCLNAKLEWSLCLEKESLQKRIYNLNKQISDLKENYSQTNEI